MDKEKKRCLSIISHDFLDDIEFWDDELDSKASSPAGLNSPEPAEILLSVANFNSQSSISKIKKILNANSNLTDLDKYMESVYSSLVDSFGSTVTDLIMLNCQNDVDCSNIAAASDSISAAAESIFQLATSFCDAVSSDLGKDGDGGKIASFINVLNKTIVMDISYSPIPAITKSTGEIVYCDSFHADSSVTALYLCFILTVRKRKQIRRCKVCGKYFIPTAKSNEIYCKNCRKTTYDTKIKQDDVLSAYRTIYKTQNARKQRNSYKPHIAEKFEKWKEFAGSKLRQCQNQEITLEEMRESISSDNWINDTL